MNDGPRAGGQVEQLGLFHEDGRPAVPPPAGNPTATSLYTFENLWRASPAVAAPDAQRYGPVVASTAPDLETLRAVVRRHLPAGGFRAFLFGSRAAGSAAANADWDIGIDGPVELPGHVLQRIAQDLEDLPTLHRFDVVDMKTVSDSFRKSAMRHTVPL